MSIKTLYQSLSQRKRPEDIAEMILDVLKGDLSSKENRLLRDAAKGSLKNRFLGYTSMLEDFARPIGANKQIKTACALFQLTTIEEFDYNKPEKIEAFVKEVAPIICKDFGSNNFVADRLNKEQRAAKGLDISKRNYNKKWRLLKRIEKKQHKLLGEIRKSEFQQIAKHGLAHQITKQEFCKDAYSACFIAYYTARCNLRSRFTIGGQTRPYDDICAMLFKKCTGDAGFFKKKIIPVSTNWWAIAHVYPSLDVLKQLSDKQKGQLLGKWTSILQEIADLLGHIWKNNHIRRKTMIVQRGNDSSTWNNTAGAWNKARDSWMNLIYATGTEYILDDLCFGKVLRLMAGDVVAWHHITGGSLDSNTIVWNELPLPWKVFSNEVVCNKTTVIAACKKAQLDPEKSGWIAPRKHGVVKFTPTPELVHGVAVCNPFLASVLKKNKYFSGKMKSTIK